MNELNRPCCPLQRPRRWAMAVATCIALLSSIGVRGQDQADAGRNDANGTPTQESDSHPGASDLPGPDGRQADDAAGPVQYVGPDTYILMDSEGRPQPMPGMTYEDFMAAWRHAQNLEARSNEPRYAIDNARFEGRALERHAELKVEFSVRLFTNQRVAVPLGLVGAVLDGQPHFKRAPRKPLGDASDATAKIEARDEAPFLHYDPQEGGFVAWFAALPGDQYTVTMNLLVPLAHNGTARTLQLSCPRALSSKLSLEVDSGVTDVSATEGAVLTRTDLAGGNARLDVAGVAGQFRLTWNYVDSELAEPATVLSAIGRIDVSIDGRSVQTHARLSVQSYGGEFERFRVRLPAGAKLVEERDPDEGVPGNEAALRISVESPSASAIPGGGAAQDRQVVLVELREKQQGPVELNLSTEQPLGVLDDDLTAELGGFEVIGAVRQFGDVALTIANDWQSRWETRSNVRQVEPSELAASLDEPGITAAFQYDRQPWSLAVRLAAQSFQIRVTPEYHLECLPDEARLQTRLAYQVLGARAFEFQVDLEGWELTADPIESGGLVDRDRVVVTRDQTLVLRLVEPSSRRAEISFNLRRSTPRDNERISLPLPIPKAESVGSGTLTVDSPPGIELVPDSARSLGLAAMPVDAAPIQDEPAPSEDFRFRTLIPEVVFVADRIRRPREVTSEIVSRVTVSDFETEVVQRISYDVSFEPVHELMFDVPAQLVESDTPLDIALVASRSGERTQRRGETPLAIQPMLAESTSNGASAERFRVPLPQPRTGRFTIVVRYSVARAPGDGKGGDLLLPLIQPADGRMSFQRAEVHAPRSLSVGLQNESEQTSWISQADNGAHRRETLELVSTRREPLVHLSVQSVDANSSSTTTIERVWLQAWVAGDVRQDRAVFQFRTAGPAVTVELPPETMPDEVEARLDGALARNVTRSPGRLVVWLDETSGEVDGMERDADKVHTLELRYRRPSADGLIVRRQFSPPQVVGVADLSEVYWHIVLPGETHVVRSPRNLASVSRWQWLGSFFGRHPTRTQEDLEAWVNASRQLAPTAPQNEYLYTGLAPLKSIEIVTAPRWLIVTLASAALLGVGLLWIYIPVVRRGWVVLAIACVLAALAVAFPAPAVLLGQAAALGILLSIFAGLISRLTIRPRAWTQPPRSSGSSLRHLTPRAEAAHVSPLSVAASTAPTAPLQAADSHS